MGELLSFYVKMSSKDNSNKKRYIPTLEEHGRRKDLYCGKCGYDQFYYENHDSICVLVSCKRCQKHEIIYHEMKDKTDD